MSLQVAELRGASEAFPKFFVQSGSLSKKRKANLFLHSCDVISHISHVTSTQKKCHFTKLGRHITWQHRRPKLTIRGIDQILMVYVRVSSET